MKKLLFGLLLVLLALSAAGPLRAAPDAGFARFDGRWSYAAGAEGRDAAIDELVAQAPALLRGHVRDELSEASVIPEWLDIDLVVETCQVALGTESMDAVAAELDGAEVRFTDSQGRSTSLRRQVGAGTAIREAGQRGLGRRNAVYRVVDGVLWIDVVLSHPAMPDSLSYTLRYQRR